MKNISLMIQTDRLILRSWHENDADDLFRYASDVRVSEIAQWPCHTSIEMSRDVINKFFIRNDCTLAVVWKDTGEVIGCIGLVPAGEEHYPVNMGEREAGYWIGYPHWGKGIATEALKSLMTYCKDSLGLDSLILTTDGRNKRSQRVAEKCGFIEFDRYIFNGIRSLVYRRIL